MYCKTSQTTQGFCVLLEFKNKTPPPPRIGAGSPRFKWGGGGGLNK